MVLARLRRSDARRPCRRKREQPRSRGLPCDTAAYGPYGDAKHSWVHSYQPQGREGIHECAL